MGGLRAGFADLDFFQFNEGGGGVIKNLDVDLEQNKSTHFEEKLFEKPNQTYLQMIYTYSYKYFPHLLREKIKVHFNLGQKGFLFLFLTYQNGC